MHLAACGMQRILQTGHVSATVQRRRAVNALMVSFLLSYSEEPQEEKE